MGSENFPDAHGQPSRPALGLSGIVDLGALFHAGSGILSDFLKLVTGISKQTVIQTLGRAIEMGDEESMRRCCPVGL